MLQKVKYITVFALIVYLFLMGVKEKHLTSKEYQVIFLVLFVEIS